MRSAVELRRRADVLYRQSRVTSDPGLARLLTLRALRMMNEANEVDRSAGVSLPVAELYRRGVDEQMAQRHVSDGWRA